MFRSYPSEIERPIYTELLLRVYDITVQDDGDASYRAFLVGADVPMLVDTGLPEATDALVEGLKRIGLEPERAVITCGDADHIGGLEAKIMRYDVMTCVSEETDVNERVVDRRYDNGDEIGSFATVHVPRLRMDSTH